VRTENNFLLVNGAKPARWRSTLRKIFMTPHNHFKFIIRSLAVLCMANAYSQAVQAESKVQPSRESMHDIQQFSDALTLIARHHISPVSIAQITRPCLKSSNISAIELSDTEAIDPLVQEFQKLDGTSKQTFFSDCLSRVLASLGPHNRLISLASNPDFIWQGGTDAYAARGPASIGLEFETNQIPARVFSVIEGSPAEQAGILADDEFVSIDGASVSGLPVSGLIALLRGAVGSTVELSLKRSGRIELLNVKVKRDLVKLKYVRTKLFETGIVYLEFAFLSPPALSELRTELTLLRKNFQKPLKGIVVDLRRSPGGEFDTTLEFSAWFLPNDAQLATVVGRTDNHQPYIVKDVRKAATSKPFWRPADELEPSLAKELKTIPLAVLISPSTSSGAEIVAAALQDYGRAKLFGERSFGKGTVETVFPLASEKRDAIKLTTLHIFRMNKVPLEALGVTPNEEVTTDPQTIKLLRKKEVNPLTDTALQRVIDSFTTSAAK
jgi:C-terminal processing protease CtpA/Prc